MSNSYTVTLAANATTGDGAALMWPGGKGSFQAEATWGGGSAKLQFISLNGTWIDYPSGSLSANGAILFELPIGQIRVVIATATACYAYAAKI
jgi:hypothetical protein